MRARTAQRGGTSTHATLALALAAALLATSLAAPAVADVEPDPVMTVPTPVATPLTALTSASGGWWLDSVAAPAVWPHAGGETPTVAVVDTAIDAESAGIEAERLADPIDVTGDAEPHVHGTVSAALAAGSEHGVCRVCEVLPVAVLGSDGAGNASDVAAGVNAAVDAGADVISLSLGGPMGSRRLAAAVDRAVAADVVVVAAAGNAGTTEAFYPAAYEGVLAVAGHDRDGQRYRWSNHGDWVDVAAPGCAGVGGLAACGTSVATPLAAAGVGLLASTGAAPAGTATLEALSTTGPPVDYVAGGRVDLAAAHEALAGAAVEAPGVEVTDLPADPTAAAVALSQARFADGEADEALLARADDFADALAASALAGERPVLLAEGDALPAVTRDELARVLGGEGHVWALGGPAALADDVVEAAAEHIGSAARLAGDDRVATALAVAAQADDGGQAFLARSDDWADAVAVAGPAAADGAPVLLTPGEALDGRVAAHLAEAGYGEVTLLGDHAALSAEVAEAVAEATGAAPRRLAGADRGATAVAIAEALVDPRGPGAVVIPGFAPSGWRAGLAAAPLAAAEGLPILLTDRDGGLCAATRAALVAGGATGSLHLHVAGPLPAQALHRLGEHDG